MRGATSPGFRLTWIAVCMILAVFMISVPSVADAQTPFDHQYGSSVVSPEISERGKAVAAAFTGVLPETGGVPFVVLGALLVSTGTGLFVLRHLGRRTDRRDR